MPGKVGNMIYKLTDKKTGKIISEGTSKIVPPITDTKPQPEVLVRCSCGRWHYMPAADYRPEGEPYECKQCFYGKYIGHPGDA